MGFEIFVLYLGKRLSPEEKLYLKCLEVESHGDYRSGVFQEFARSFGVRHYSFMLQSSKANQTRLKTATEFKRRDWGTEGFGSRCCARRCSPSTRPSTGTTPKSASPTSRPSFATTGRNAKTWPKCSASLASCRSRIGPGTRKRLACWGRGRERSCLGIVIPFRKQGPT